MLEKALFIGHSLVGPTMPDMFNSFMADQGLSATADAQVINGAPLRWNWDNGASAEGVNARDVLPSGDYNAVIVTEAIPLDAQIMWNDSEGYAKQYYDLAIGANPDTQFYVYETWHYIGDSTDAWRAQIASDLSAWEGIVDHINDTRPNGAPEALIVPAGQAMGNLHDAIEAGRVPGLDSIRDLFSDDIHFNDVGAWFIAALQAEVVAGVDAASLPLETATQYGEAYGGPDAAMAEAFNTVIDQTLEAYQRDGVDGGTTTAPVEPVTPVIPEVPAEPETPAEPVVPVEPAAPVVEPVEAPVDTIVPETPSVPVVPETPVDDASHVFGDDLGNTLVGGAGVNEIFGFSGDDILIGGAGDDRLDGGPDWDGAIYNSGPESYTLTLGVSGIEVEDRRADGTGTDLLAQIENVQFRPEDGQGSATVVDLTKVAGTVDLSQTQLENFVELYIAYYNRAPDSFGLNFWGTAHANGMSLEDVASLFMGQPETREMYPDGMSNDAFVTAVYNNALGRSPDAEGQSFWSNQLDSGAVGRDQFILSVLQGAKAEPGFGASDAFVTQQAEDRAYLSDKTDIGAYFSVHLGMSNTANAETVMEIFDGSDVSFDRAIDQIEAFYADASQADGGAFLMPLVGVLATPDWV